LQKLYKNCRVNGSPSAVSRCIFGLDYYGNPKEEEEVELSLRHKLKQMKEKFCGKLPNEYHDKCMDMTLRDLKHKFDNCRDQGSKFEVAKCLLHSSEEKEEEQIELKNNFYRKVEQQIYRKEKFCR